ncbi:MAG: hypothetical protein PHN64_04610 [Desulfovibrionaceae bacterium]|nr:hypothetical protein [Desulfovibrionaceae bacterium]
MNISNKKKQSVTLLTFEDGLIQLGGKELPGFLEELRVDGKVKFDEQAIDGASGKKKTPQGWEDADISATLYLATDQDGTCYDKLTALAGFFQQPDAKANPQMYTVTNRHLLARGVRQVIFSRLESAENMQTDEIRASLAFVEHRPPIIKTEQAQAKTPTSKELAQQAKEKAATASKAEPEEVLKVGLE